MKSILVFLIFILSSCQSSQEVEFSKLQNKLSKHFSYSLLESEVEPFMNCKKYVFSIKGKANSNLRITSYDKAFIPSVDEFPSTLNEVSFNRVKEERIDYMRTLGIKEHCLEVKDFECVRYHFRDPTDDDLLSLTQKLDDQYSISLQKGEVITNKVQMEICPSRKVEISYFVQVPSK